MKKLMHFFVLSCKKATALIEKRSVAPLSFTESIQLRIHKSVCDACAAYEKQSRSIDALLNKQHRDPDDQTVISNPQLKDRILRNMPKS
jgi:hypothetical protein